MKKLIFVYLVLALILGAALSVGCRGREQPTVLPPAQWLPVQQPAGQQPAQQPSGQQPAPKQPDLTITEATVTLTGNPGEVRIRIVARNQGGPISAAFTVRWHPHQKDKTQVGCSQDFYDLNQSEWVVDCAYVYPANQRGEMHWLAVVDAENDVKNESNENNNDMTGTITIGSLGGQPPPPAAQVPPAPTNCRTRIPTSGAGQVYVDWDFAGQPAPSGFRIYQGTASLEKTVGGNERSVLLSNLMRGVQYHFDVRASNTAGESRADACNVDVTPPR